MNDALLELLSERLVERINQANIVFLKKIGGYIKQIKDLTPTQAQQLVQILKYNGNYEEILKEISRLTGINTQEIDTIFKEYAKKDQYFYKQFYEYRNLPFVPFEQNLALKRQTEALANISKQTMANFTRSRALGYSLSDVNGNIRFYGLRETYEKVLDEALLNVGQGKDTFDSQMSKILKELGGSGLKTLDYASGRSIRLDSMVRMHLKSGLRELHNENQRLLGEEFGANGVEISVHQYPAEDHQDAQGKQFTYDEFVNLQNTGIAKTVDDEEINIHLFDKEGNQALTHRPISEYNCYHYAFSIVVGVSKPQYSKEQLDKIIKDNNKGFELDGKHYSMYDGTQLQRKLELEIRKAKDTQILAKESNDNELIYNSQRRITELTRSYKELSDISGLPTKAKRLKVSGYKRVRI